MSTLDAVATPCQPGRALEETAGGKKADLGSLLGKPDSLAKPSEDLLQPLSLFFIVHLMETQAHLTCCVNTDLLH